MTRDSAAEAHTLSQSQDTVNRDHPIIARPCGRPLPRLNTTTSSIVNIVIIRPSIGDSETSSNTSRCRNSLVGNISRLMKAEANMQKILPLILPSSAVLTTKIQTYPSRRAHEPQLVGHRFSIESLWLIYFPATKPKESYPCWLHLSCFPNAN